MRSTFKMISTMSQMFWALLATGLIMQSTIASIEVTEEDIDKYIQGIEELQNAFKESPPQVKLFDPLEYDENAAFKNAEDYDFVVVGAGTAGSVVASRLSEISSWKVLLLEAGDNETPYTQIPALAEAMAASQYSWRYTTEPQETWCLGMTDRKCTSPTGKGLGGATSMNGMVYTRGNSRDFDLWSDQGNPGWSYADVLPYFKKAENCVLKECDKKYHHQGGPLYIEEAQNLSPLLSTFLSAGTELGYKVIDYNGKEQVGFSKSQATTKNGKRHSAAQSYLVPNQKRKNLRIKPLSHVIQILIEPKTNVAMGVKYVHNGVMYIAKANKEVILSAGPFNSAQLLMLSGIGPQEDLKKLDIPVLKNLQVGRYFKDHTAFLGLTFILNLSKIEEANLHEQITTWLKHGQGPLARVATTGLAFIQTDASKDTADFPDVEIVLVKAAFSNSLRVKKTYKHILEPATSNETFRIEVRPTRPKSVGTMRLASKNPYEMPLINPRQFSDPDDHDIETMLGGIKKVLQLIKTNAFQKLGAYLFPEGITDCEDFKFGTDNYWKCSIRHLTRGARHQTGTCKMGPPSDKNAVVDEKLRVRGIDKLRVADTSVVPVSITGHTHAVANMVGEKAADLLKSDWL